MPPDRRGERQGALRRRLADGGFDALLVTHGPNVRYLTGFAGSAGMVLLTATGTVLITDPRYEGQAQAEAGAAADVQIEPRDLWHRLGAVLRGMRAPALAFEGDHLTVRGAERLAAFNLPRVEPVAGWVEALRLIKAPEEVEAIRRAAALSLDAFQACLPLCRPGARECDIAAGLEAALRRGGSEWHPFQTIVASGPRSALPHARTTERPVARGELLLLDFGAIVDGYCADLTRTVVIGTATALHRERYQAVREAQSVAMREMRAGMTGQAVDALGRQVLAAVGLGEAFRHSLGHGLGLEVHEDPRLARTAEEAIPAGAVVTVEPGVYLEGWGGIRLEDDVHLTAEGPIPVSPGAPDLLEVG